MIEFHEWKNEEEYTITNELYRSEVKDRVGDRVPLSELYEELDETTTIKGLSRPLFTYLKTAGMNNKDINSPLGLSIFDNAKSTIDFINTTYDEFKWEVKMGQRRVAVPEQTVRTEFNSRNEKVTVTRKFDPNQNVYDKFDTGSLDGSINITDLTTPIRSEDYIKAINEGLSLFEMQIGVSAGMFSFDGKSMKTATEIVSENSDTYQMRNSWLFRFVNSDHSTIFTTVLFQRWSRSVLIWTMVSLPIATMSWNTGRKLLRVVWLIVRQQFNAL